MNRPLIQAQLSWGTAGTLGVGAGLIGVAISLVRERNWLVLLGFLVWSAATYAAGRFAGQEAALPEPPRPLSSTRRRQRRRQVWRAHDR